MKFKHAIALNITILVLLLISHTTKADTIDQDLATICGWYQSVATDEKFKNFSAKDKFSYVFNAKIQHNIKNIQMKMFYSALRTTESTQRYELMKGYAEGTTGKNWECLPMKEIMKEFNSIDRLYQYAR